MPIKWNKVTWYSKIMALTLFIILPFYGFWLGAIYGSIKQQQQDVNAELRRVVAVSSQQALSPVIMPTTVIKYVPVIPTNAVAVSGSCWTNSIAAPYRDDAWRCTVGNAIQDPCFTIPGSAKVACGDPENTTNTARTVISLTKPLPKPAGHLTPATPADGAWLIKLGDGTFCAPFTGTLPFSNTGDVAAYSCNDKRLIFGALNTETQTWTAEVGMLGAATKDGPPPLIAEKTVPVATVWQ